MSSAQSRMPLIDMVKALACIAIVWHHLAFYGPMSDIAYSLAPALMAWLYDHARIAVQVFLVVGGYLAAGSLAPQGLARFGQWGPTVGRRFVRLVVPYAVALVVTVAVSAILRPWFGHASVPEGPTFVQLLANALLLQDVLGEGALSAGVWYVAIDFQLFALSAFLFAAVRTMPEPAASRYAAALGQGMVVAGTAASLWLFNRASGLDMWAIYFFGAYGLGMLAFWAVHAPQARGWVALMLLLGGVALSIDYRSRILVALLTALTMVWALRSQALRQWQGVRPLVLLGQMSYSVFLVHFAVCMLVNAVVSTLWPTSPALNALGMVLAFGLSLAMGRLLYQRVERQVPTWRTALHWQCGLIGAGLLLTVPAQWV